MYQMHTKKAHEKKRLAHAQRFHEAFAQRVHTHDPNEFSYAHLEKQAGKHAGALEKTADTLEEKRYLALLSAQQR